MGKLSSVLRRVLGAFGFSAFLPLFFAGPLAGADDSVCARVKIEIKQELSLERQGFDAAMSIINGLDTLSLENVGIVVKFTDEAGAPVIATSNTNDTTAKFFIRVDTMTGINNVAGTGTVAPSTTAEIHWLIVPASGSAGNLPSGKLYFVGATLSYTLGGEAQVTEVTPDFIRVKPMPLLALDYFLTQDVVADDPFTTVIEPVEPFTLGVRVKNSGQGVASKVNIESAQPKIIENKQGLLIGFDITGSSLNDLPGSPTLLINFGDIAPGAATVGRWIMTTTLSGQFTDFTASFTHSDELGGALTSLIQATNTHFLIHDVQVDLPGRDLTRDFLALDSSTLRAYESDGVDTQVSDQSAFATFSSVNASTYHLQTPATAGLMFVKLPDPFSGQKIIKDVQRSDGKHLSLNNAWFSKKQDKTTHEWSYFVNFFDSNSTGSYTVVLDGIASIPHPPVLQFIPNRVTAEGKQISFIVEASDPDGTTPSITAAPLPVGAVFNDQGTGTALFDWTPVVGQTGTYSITYTASDGVLKATRTATIKVNSATDTDGDGMPDAWEMQNFGTLDRDGTGDLNGNGISDLQEFLNGTDPRVVTGPGLPAVKAPAFGTQVTTLTPSLAVFNSSHEPAQTITYEFEVYSDEAMSQLVVKKTGVTEMTDATTWTITPALSDNTWYYWRARAFNTMLYSEWVGAKFFVNTVNDAPAAFITVAPQDATTVATYTPTLQINNSADVDGDPVRYAFEVFADSSLSTRVAFINNLTAGDLGTTSWTVDLALSENKTYYWRAIASDDHGAQTASNVARFFVNTVNDAPTTPTIAMPFNGSRVAAYSVDLVANNAEDPEGGTLTYSFEIDTVNTFDSSNKMSASSIAQGETTTQWTVTSLTENTTYFWRVRAHDGSVYSDWSLGAFLVSVVNDPPAKPTIKNPGALSWIETVTPTLSANPVVDPEGDVVSYRFELYTNSNLSGFVGEFVSTTGEWIMASPLSDNSWYYWRVRAEDDMGAPSNWTALSSFFVNNNGYDDPPSLTFLEPTADITATGGTVTIHWDDIDPDSNASIALYFNTASSGSGGTLIVSGLAEDPDSTADSYVWDISSLAPGKYWVYAVLTDGHVTVTTYAPHTVTVIPIERIVDNRDVGATAYGDWPASTSVAGYLGVDYQYHAANGAAPGTLIVDNRDAGFSNPSGWRASSATAGYYGLDDVEKLVVPVSASSAGTVLDNSDATFTKVGTWTAATTPTGFNGSNYLYHAASTVAPGTVFVDNTDTNVTKVGTWTTSTAVTGYYGSNFAYRAAGTGANKFTWSPKPTTTDQYMVYARWTSSSTRATNARYTINYNGGSAVVIANQQANGGTWNLLGTYSFKAATTYAITLTDQANGVVIADAVMLVPVNAIYNSASWNFSVTTAGQYQVYGRWVSARDRATNATYTIANSSGTATVAVNQQLNSGTWVLLGIYNFAASTRYSVKLTDQANGVVVADAVKLVKVPDPTSVSWSFTIPATNTYNVYAQWSAATNRATDAKYTVNSAAGAATIAQNQQLNGGTWNLLGTYTFNQSTAYSVSLSDQANGYVVGDAIKVVATNAAPNSFTWTLDIPKTGTYKVYSRWTAGADRATNSTYAIESDSGNVSVVANQQLNGGQWNLLGTYHYTQGNAYRVTVTDLANGNVIADGLRIERVGP